MKPNKYYFKNKKIKLIIEEDVVGCYLIAYGDLSTPNVSTADYLFDSVEMAFQEAYERFGIKNDQWLRVDEG